MIKADMYNRSGQACAAEWGRPVKTAKMRDSSGSPGSLQVQLTTRHYAWVRPDCVAQQGSAA